MNYRYAFLVFFGAFLLQSTILKHVAILGVGPDLLLVLVIVFSFLFEENYAVIYGVLFGLIYDICFSLTIGASALCYFCIAFFIAGIRRYIYRDNYLSILFLTIMATVLHSVIFWGILTIFEGNYSFMRMVLNLPVAVVYNFVLTAVLQRIFVKRVIRYRGDRYI